MLTQPNNNIPKEQVPFMNTSTAIINKAVKDGYHESFQVDKRGIYAQSNSRYYRPEQIKVINFYRFEGQSDPGDNSILYVIETSDGLKGTLIDAYGPYADANVNKFMTEVEDIQKKVTKHDA